MSILVHFEGSRASVLNCMDKFRISIKNEETWIKGAINLDPPCGFNKNYKNKLNRLSRNFSTSTIRFEATRE